MARASSSAPLPGCGLGHRVGDGPVPRRRSTAAVTSGGSSVSPDPEFAKKRKRNRRQRSPRRQVRLGRRLARAWRRQSRLTRPLFPDRSEPQRSEPQRGASELERPLVGLRFGPSCWRRPRTSPPVDRRHHHRRRPHQRRRQRSPDPEFAKKRKRNRRQRSPPPWRQVRRGRRLARVEATKQVNAAPFP